MNITEEMVDNIFSDYNFKKVWKFLFEETPDWLNGVGMKVTQMNIYEDKRGNQLEYFFIVDMNEMVKNEKELDAAICSLFGNKLTREEMTYHLSNRNLI